MAIKLKEIAGRPEKLAPGHRLCAGCAESVVVRQILHAIDEPVVIATATGCLEIATSMYPNTAWRVPWIHNAFENAATTASGIEAMYKALIRKGRMADRNIKFLAFGGDGATYDIGLQWISGAFERGHKLVYICLNNEAYMNTGIQRSSATELGANTTTSPAGEVIPGKAQWPKPLTEIMAAHGIPYTAQANPWRYQDLMEKARKAVAADGPAFINVISPCPRGWRHEPSESIQIARLATETCVWPLFEVENGVWKLNYKPREKKPLIEWFKSQGRFRHLFTPAFEYIIAEAQEHVDREWERLLRMCGETA
jgi:pyruvate ferredoxin oxidoreductase beta subunit